MDPERFALIRRMMEEQVPFNKVLGLRIDEAAEGKARLSFDFRPELVGNFVMGILHGGVIASVLDVAGGLAVVASYAVQEPMHGLGTVDLRVDYLRPGKGRHFVVTAETVRPGRRLAATRMELHNDEDVLIAMGTGMYRISAQTEQTPVNL